jgi:hypothetical protein
MADRRSQPYRRGPRVPGPALTAMMKGRTASGFNPKDLERNVQKLVSAGKSRKRPERPTRPERPQRPPR